MAAKKPLPRIGVDMYTYFPITEGEEGDEYGTAVSLPGTVEIAPTDEGGSAVFEADNVVYTSASYIANMGHEITNADIPPETDAAWRGLEPVNGVLTVTNEAKSPKFGVAWRVKKADGTYRYVRYYKGVYSFASAVGGQTKSTTGEPEYTTAQATFTAEANAAGQYYSYVDETDLNATDAAAIKTQWFTDPEWVPTGEQA